MKFQPFGTDGKVFDGPEPCGLLAIELCKSVFGFLESRNLRDMLIFDPGQLSDLSENKAAIGILVNNDVSRASRALLADANGIPLVLKTFAGWKSGDTLVTADSVNAMPMRDLRALCTAAVLLWVELGFFDDMPRASGKK